MNYRGSYRKLLANSRAAMVAAVEIYNKPRFDYREECFVILLMNSWELLLKAILSKNKQSIFYKKKRHEPYRTLSQSDAMNRVAAYFPPAIPSAPVSKNLDLLSTFRDNAVHFYNDRDFGVLIYALAQTAISNYRDLVYSIFRERLEDVVNWRLLPLGIKAPIDPVEYFQAARAAGEREEHPSAVSQFVAELARAVGEVEQAGLDTGRLMTIFKVKLESTKKVQTADLVVPVAGAIHVMAQPAAAAPSGPPAAGAVQVNAAGPATLPVAGSNAAPVASVQVVGAADLQGPLVVTRTQDPNITHPLRQKEALAILRNEHGRSLSEFQFQACVAVLGIKADPQKCWKADGVSLTRYSREVVATIRNLSEDDLGRVVSQYKQQRKAAAAAGGPTP